MDNNVPVISKVRFRYWVNKRWQNKKIFEVMCGHVLNLLWQSIALNRVVDKHSDAVKNQAPNNLLERIRLRRTAHLAAVRLYSDLNIHFSLTT